MYIRDMFDKEKSLISLEIFPPKKESKIETIYDTIFKLKELRPDFISVTYGAGGSTKDTTIDVSSFIHRISNVPSLAHLTCLTSNKEELNITLDSLHKQGVKNILALRGDYPLEGYHENHGFKYASDLVKHIKENYDFCIGGACYPEKHLECESLHQDIDNLKQKVDSGVEFLISQLFFDNNLFYEYKDKVRKKNINVPILAGVLPILNKNQVKRIIELTGCSLPKKIKKIIEKYEHSPNALREAGLAYAIEQIIDLLSWDTDGIHIYTMNKPKATSHILNNIKAIRGVVCDECAC
ncbi:methylenetetrahydrofolate reductase [NAD(P)H] [Clostridiaceae bacterium M8S5]|nr:methylenetetrahydrofolate reductase [NAD(P)H] [Clostridiaceae bacterium M8S5]